ncbi:MAG: 5'/3'-nucleotidase SurE [Candidatus Omnitrophica bacterium]|nr:5'/3'-nucleotidase SurE [Candidatus Omnitrophota bacterium]
MTRLKILLTNDDGVFAPGIMAMWRELKKLGDVTIVAPDGERSSISQAITLNHPLYHRVVPFAGKATAHALSGTPTDCVKFARSIVLKVKPDILVSGINDGSNDGCSVFYSGTVGAAREGALMGIPSVAVSLDTGARKNFDFAARAGCKVVQWVIKNSLPGGVFLNVNVPDTGVFKTGGIKFFEHCPVSIHSEFRIRKDPFGRTYYWLTGRPPAKNKGAVTDTQALKNGHVTVVPVHCDVTDRLFLKQYASSAI